MTKRSWGNLFFKEGVIEEKGDSDVCQEGLGTVKQAGKSSAS